jgi:3-oxoacyl-[acyl-carrier protein] reductase
MRLVYTEHALALEADDGVLCASPSTTCHRQAEGVNVASDPLAVFRLDDRVAVITGAASGIGEATAELFAAVGAAVVCADIDGAGATRTAERITAAGGQAIPQECDATNRDQVFDLVAKAVEAYGGLDVMCNVAGAMFAGLIEDLDETTIDRAVQLNLKSVIFGCQAAVGAMKEHGGGAIINIASGAMDMVYEGIGAYAFTKAAVDMVGRTLALEVGKHGIRVNTLAPGTTITNFTTWRLKNEDGSTNQEAYDIFVANMRALSPLGLIGEASDQANLMLYLASDAGRFVTGCTFRANGGQVML